ncbi:hypothetical protein KSF78_0003989 [Schistosoma japonicum]|nr:hypothetical protein KSF78_0003989 [Schistosoma japonicum]KAH8868424.1 hypothetical protein KSF78_0003989 [Schistosoma japonicum]
MEFLRDLLIHLHTFKLKLIFRRNMFKRHNDFLLDYRQISREKLSWSAEDLNKFECEWETSYFNIIKQCEEILLLTGIHFRKEPVLWDEEVLDFRQRFLTPSTNRSTQLMRSRSAPVIFFLDVYSKNGKNTFNEAVNHEKKDSIHRLTCPNVTVRSLSTRSNNLNGAKEKTTTIDNNLLETIPASIGELTQIKEVDQVNLLRGVNVGELGKFFIEISLIQEIRTHRELSTLLEYLETQTNVSVECLTQYAHASSIEQFICIPKNVSENVVNIESSHSKLGAGNLSDHRNHRLPGTQISPVIDIRFNNFMLLFIFYIFSCLLLLEFISISNDYMSDCYILKAYLYMKYGIKNAYTKYLGIYSGLFDVSLILEYPYGTPPV